MNKKQKLKYLDKFIYDRLNTPVARRTRRLAALSFKNPIIKIRWDK